MIGTVTQHLTEHSMDWTLSDAEIANGFDLTDSGKQKVASRLGIAPREVKLLLASLTTKLRDEGSAESRLMTELAGEEHARFDFESDALGNVTIYDTQSGKEVFLRGADATALLDKLKHNPDHQALLARYEKLMEAPIDQNERDHYDALAKTGFYGKQGAGCIIMARDTGRFLLPLRSRYVEEPGTWGTWGGALDRGEDPLEAVEREVHEEAGYAGPVKVYPLYVFTKGSFSYHNFLVVVDKEFRPRLNWETDRANWFDYGDWPQPLHFGLKGLLADRASIHVIMTELKKTGFGGDARPVEEDVSAPYKGDPFEHMFKVMGFHETEFQSVWRKLKRDGVYTQPMYRSYAKWTPGQWAQVNNQIAPEFEVTPDPQAQTFTIHAKAAFESIEEDADYEADIEGASGGSYNFVWKLDGQSGVGTARWSGLGRAMKVKVISVRDHNGDDVDLSPQDTQAIADQALDFIGKE